MASRAGDSNQSNQGAASATQPPSTPATGKLRVMAFASGSSTPLRDVEIVLTDEQKNVLAVAATTDAEGAKVWDSLKPGKYFIAPGTTMGCRAPTSYHTLRTDGRLDYRSCTEPVEVVRAQESTIQLIYIEDAAAELLELLRGVVATPRPASSTPPVALAAMQAPTACPANVCVNIVQVNDLDDSFECGDSSTGLAGATVSLSNQSGYCSSEETSATGQVCFSDIPAGSGYSISVEPPAGYTPIKGQWIIKPASGGQTTQDYGACKFDLQENDDVTICGAFAPTRATLTVCAFADLDRCGESSNHQPLGSVQVQVLRDGKRVGCLENCTPEELPPGRLSLLAPPTLTLETGEVVRLLSSAPTTLILDPGEKREIELTYVPGLAAITLSASVLDVSGSISRSHALGGVEIALYRGTTISGDPIRTLLTRDIGPSTFSDLDEGDYVLAVANAPTTYNGHAIAIGQGAGAIHQVNLRAGAVANFADLFRFEHVLGRIVVSAVDAESNEALEGVGVILRRSVSTSNGLVNLVGPVATDQYGEAVFDVAPGSWLVGLVEDPVTLAGGQPWVLDEASSAQLSSPLQVTTGTARAELRLIRDIHRISGIVKTTDGTPVGFAVIQVQDERGTVLDTVNASSSGAYEWIAPRAGKYFLQVQDTQSGAALRRFPAVVGQPVNVDLLVDGGPFDLRGIFKNGSTGSGGNSSEGNSSSSNGSVADDTVKQLSESAIDLTAYPILTEEVSFPMSSRPSPGAPSSGGTSSLAQMAESAVRDVLSWRPRDGDPNGFTAALNSAFSLQNVEGHTQWKWTPRSYTVQTDLGGLSGAQASLYTRAKAALDQCLPLLDGLTELNEVPRPDLDSLRAVVRQSLVELVNEFGLLGGPRVERVTELFGLLLGFDTTEKGKVPSTQTDPEQVRGQLLALKQRFGLDRSRINSVDDEQDYSNFLILADTVIGLLYTWNAQLQYFVPNSGAEPYLGTQLVLLSRDLEVVSELVNEASFAMDSVFLGPAQRQTVQLSFSPGPQSMFLADLMDWIYRVATDEGPRMIQNGKDGVVAFAPIIKDLANFASQALVTGYGGQQSVNGSPGGNGTIPAAYASPRVQRALQALARQLTTAHKHAKKIRPPSIGDLEFGTGVDAQEISNIVAEVIARLNGQQTATTQAPVKPRN